MHILSPVKNLLSGIEIIKSGVGEIYFGIVSEKWEENHKYKSILNRRDGKLANISSYEDGEKLINVAKKHNVKSFITLNNSPVIVDEKLIIEEIKNCISIKPDALIVKDIYIAHLVRTIDKNIQIHCSSLNQSINIESVKFWIENFNISRMILPRNVSINEIKYLCNSFKDLEFEIFIKNDWCYNSDGVCSSLHLEGLTDGIPYVCNREGMYESEDKVLEKSFRDLTRKGLDCKVCMLRQLKGLKNLVSLKIVGREKNHLIILNDIKFIKNSLQYLELAESNNDYMDFNISLHKKVISRDCGYPNCEVYKEYYIK